MNTSLRNKLKNLKLIMAYAYAKKIKIRNNRCGIFCALILKVNVKSQRKNYMKSECQ